MTDFAIGFCVLEGIGMIIDDYNKDKETKIAVKNPNGQRGIDC